MQAMRQQQAQQQQQVIHDQRVQGIYSFILHVVIILLIANLSLHQ